MHAINYAKGWFGFGFDGGPDPPPFRRCLGKNVRNQEFGTWAGTSVKGGSESVGGLDMEEEVQGVESCGYVSEDDEEDSVLGVDRQVGNVEIEDQHEFGDVIQEIPNGDENSKMAEMELGGYTNDTASIQEMQQTTLINTIPPIKGEPALESEQTPPSSPQDNVNAITGKFANDFENGDQVSDTSNTTDTKNSYSPTAADTGEFESMEQEEKHLVLQRPGNDDDEYLDTLSEGKHEQGDSQAHRHEIIEDVEDGLDEDRGEYPKSLMVRLKYNGRKARGLNERKLNDRKEHSQVFMGQGSQGHQNPPRDLNSHAYTLQPESKNLSNNRISQGVQTSPPRHGYHPSESHQKADKLSMDMHQDVVLGKRKAVEEIHDQDRDHEEDGIWEDDDEEESSDDEALMDRTRRPLGDNTKLGQASGEKSTKSYPNTSTQVRPPADSTSPTPPPTQASSPEPIDWKLPTYTIDISSPDPETHNPTLKISLPNCIRETLLLSADHPQNETRLFQQIFLPAHMALSTPDPNPTTAILNFHNITVMVLDTYHAHMTGDLLVPPGTNASFAYHAAFRNSRDEDHAKTKDAREVDETEIFFAVVDRWRAGLEEPKKKAYEMIRGPQEFAETALDVIYFVKEHGLIVERGEGESREKKERKERSDKGVKRGPRDVKGGKGKTGDGVKGKTGSKQNSRPTPNKLTARKKQKTWK